MDGHIQPEAHGLKHSEECECSVAYSKEYTAYRRFLAFVGFCTLILLALGVVTFVVWGNHYIDANLYAQ